MKRSKKNKRNKNKKNKYNEDINKDDDINDYNAAPILNQTNTNENLEDKEEEENLAPAIDNQSKDFNNYIKEFNKKREGMYEIPLNNSPQINTKKNHNTLNFMRKIYVNNLQLNIKHKDCFILLEIKSNLLKMISHQFYAEDENNQRLYISIYNFNTKFTEKEFKTGKFIIILEPWYKIYKDGQSGIRVDDPNDVILFRDKNEARIYMTKKLGDVNKYLEIGDQYFDSKDYYDALDYYKCCLELNYSNKNFKFNIYEKLIKTYLNINAYNLSLKYCNDFLLLHDKNNIDIIQYKIKTLIHLEKFEEAKKLLEENKNIFTDELYKINQENLKNNLDNKKGIFDLYKIKGNDVSEYLSKKIDFGFDKEIKGNKLIAKENIFKGELLIVSKAFYFLTNENYYLSLKEYYEQRKYKRYKTYYFDKFEEFRVEPEFYIFENLKEQKQISEIDFEKLLDLDDFDNWNVKYTERSKKYPNKQTPHLTNIANINSIKIYSSIFSCESQGYGYGLWYYPSFINHSCDPNTLEFGIDDIYFLYAQKNIKKGEEITRRYFNYGLNITNRYANLRGYGFECKCEVCTHQINFMRLKNKDKFESFIEEYNNLYDEEFPDKALYRSITYVDSFVNENGLEFDVYDLINFYFRAGYVLFNRKIYLEDCEKYLNKALILIQGKNFNYECIILRCLYILYYENANSEKLKNIEEKINNNLNDFFGNTFLKEKLLDIYQERKNVELLKKLNDKVVYIEDIEKNSLSKKWEELKLKYPNIKNVLIILSIILICFLIDMYFKIIK